MATFPTTIPESHLTHFDGFKTTWPTPEDRFKAAQVLANVDIKPKEIIHMGRNFLAAHWGHSDNDLISPAGYMYTLKDLLPEHELQPIMVFRRGSADDLLTDADDELEEDLEIDYGITTNGTLVHSFAGNLSCRGAMRMGIKPPFLGFGLAVPVVKPAKIEFDVVDGSSVQRTSAPETCLITYVGTVPLIYDLKNYVKNKKMMQREVVLGKDAVSMVIERLGWKGRASGMREALSKLELKP